MNWGKGHFAVALAPGGERKDEHQQAVKQQRGQLVPALPGVSRVGNLFQLGEQGGQIFAQEAHLFAHSVLAGLFFLGEQSCFRAVQPASVTDHHAQPESHHVRPACR
jgi:hypothetical protein